MEKIHHVWTGHTGVMLWSSTTSLHVDDDDDSVDYLVKKFEVTGIKVCLFRLYFSTSSIPSSLLRRPVTSVSLSTRTCHWRTLTMLPICFQDEL